MINGLIFQWMDDMYIVDWVEGLVDVWADKWMDRTSGMKTMAARLRSDMIIVLKDIFLLVVSIIRMTYFVCYDNYTPL